METWNRLTAAGGGGESYNGGKQGKGLVQKRV